MKKLLFGLLFMICSFVCAGQRDSLSKDMSIKLSILDLYLPPTFLELSLDKRIASKFIFQQGVGFPVYDGNWYDNSFINYKKLNIKTSTFLKYIVVEKEKSYFYCGVNLLYKQYHTKNADSVCLEWTQDTLQYYKCTNKIYDSWSSKRNEIGLRFVFGYQFFTSKNRRLVFDIYSGAGIKKIINETEYRGVESPEEKGGDSLGWFFGEIVPEAKVRGNSDVTVFSPLLGFQIGYRFR